LLFHYASYAASPFFAAAIAIAPLFRHFATFHAISLMTLFIAFSDFH